jgi:asparagine synthase (glutamine-hydrolysing)
MCGFAGIFDSHGRRSLDAALVQRMGDALAHRGPDGRGLHVAPGIGLAHRRLAIIDLSTGQQPMFSPDGTVVVVFNGEIYNYRAVRAELERAGHRFQTSSDTEVIVQGWQAWGEAVLDRLRGMFAIVLWDEAAETLMLARDRLGERPLYWSELASGDVVFGSELKALTEHPGLGRAIDPLAVEDFFAYGYIPDPRTIYRGVHKLEAAHKLIWRRGQRPHIERYWRLRMGNDGPVDTAEAVEALIHHLDEAVRHCMVADVPVGAFLSGGVDSSGVVATMAGQASAPVTTFSIGFKGTPEDETAFAAELARRYRTRHVTREVDPDDMALVDRLAAIYDEPFGDASALPTFRVSELARASLKVALSGDGADEVFAGYRRYLWHGREERVRGLLPGGLRRPLFGLLGRAWPKLDWAPRPLRFKHTFQELALDAAEGYFQSVNIVDDATRSALFAPGLKRDLGGYHAGSLLGPLMAEAGSDDPVAQAQYADLRTWLSGRMLVKVDRAAMANSLEVRVPFLDHRLVEWAARLPPRLRVRGGEKKFLLKKALEPKVPRHLLYRPKQGFAVPLAQWFRGPLAGRMRELARSAPLADGGLIETGTVARLVAEHQTGLSDHAPPLWNVLMFEAFLAREARARARDRRPAAAIGA